jgi:CHC2 zinc finger
MAIEPLLSTLHKLKRTGRGRWIACCPAHKDDKPSLGVRKLEDGRVLVHCFAGCSFEQIVDAAGVPMETLFPEKDIDYERPLIPSFNARDVLACVKRDATHVAIASANIALGYVLTDSDRDYLLDACIRLVNAAMMGDE